MNKKPAAARARQTHLKAGLLAAGVAIGSLVVPAAEATAKIPLLGKGTNHAKITKPVYGISKSGGLVTHKTRAQRAAPNKKH